MITKRLANALKNQSIALDKFAREVYTQLSLISNSVPTDLGIDLQKANKELYDAVQNESIESKKSIPQDLDNL